MIATPASIQLPSYYRPTIAAPRRPLPAVPSNSLAVPNVSAHVMRPARAPNNDGAVELSAPVVRAPSPDLFAHQYPDAPESWKREYSNSYARLCQLQPDYKKCYTTRSQFWRHAQVLHLLVDSMQPPPPYEK